VIDRQRDGVLLMEKACGGWWVGELLIGRGPFLCE